MKRIALLCLGLALGAANAAEAQLTMQMSNGWSFTFAGNVNAFFIYQTSKALDPVSGTFVTSGKDLAVGTGLLPAFAVFDAKGKEENLDLGVHFGFAPQVETGGHHASYFGTDAAGAGRVGPLVTLVPETPAVELAVGGGDGREVGVAAALPVHIFKLHPFLRGNLRLPEFSFKNAILCF